MRIGVWLGTEVIPALGGGASYMARLVRLIDNYKFDSDIDICFVSVVPQKGFKKDVIHISCFPKRLFTIFCHYKKIWTFLARANRYILRRNGLRNRLKKYDVGIIYYISQTYCFDSSFPFIATNWDIGHRSTHSFPEVTVNGIFEERELFYSSVLPKALMIICESEAGKEEIVKYTNVGEHKIRVMPMFAGSVSSCICSAIQQAEILKRVGINDSMYYFYPAQFWAHKNHHGVLQAFRMFVDRNGSNYKLVFCGSDKGNLDYIKHVVNDFGLKDQVFFLGFVSEETIYTLYKNALCLIMASHFGPTNMPPIEAMEIGCPVICSDLKGHREILGDAAVYFNSYDAESILEAMEIVTKEQDTYRNKLKLQKQATKFNVENSMACLNKILHKALVIRKNWE